MTETPAEKSAREARERVTHEREEETLRNAQEARRRQAAEEDDRRQPGQPQRPSALPHPAPNFSPNLPPNAVQNPKAGPTPARAGRNDPPMTDEQIAAGRKQREKDGTPEPLPNDPAERKRVEAEKKAKEDKERAHQRSQEQPPQPGARR